MDRRERIKSLARTLAPEAWADEWMIGITTSALAFYGSKTIRESMERAEEMIETQSDDHHVARDP